MKFNWNSKPGSFKRRTTCFKAGFIYRPESFQDVALTLMPRSNWRGILFFLILSQFFFSTALHRVWIFFFLLFTGLLYSFLLCTAFDPVLVSAPSAMTDTWLFSRPWTFSLYIEQYQHQACFFFWCALLFFCGPITRPLLLQFIRMSRHRVEHIYREGRYTFFFIARDERYCLILCRFFHAALYIYVHVLIHKAFQIN